MVPSYFAPALAPRRRAGAHSDIPHLELQACVRAERRGVLRTPTLSSPLFMSPIAWREKMRTAMLVADYVDAIDEGIAAPDGYLLRDVMPK